MKKLLALFLTALIILIPVSLFSVSADEGNQEIENGGETVDAQFSAAGFLEEFVTSYPDRSCGSKGEKAAAEFIAEKFSVFIDKYGFLPFKSEGDSKFFQSFSVTASNKTYYSQNVIITKPAKISTKKTVIIGAHYDNAYSLPSNKTEEEYAMEGAYDNGTGVAVMMDLMDRLKNVDLDFNVQFIAFGAEELVAKGSEYFANSLSKDELDNILIMFNLDVIGAGEKLYLYCDEVKTMHETYLMESAQNLNIAVNLPPLDKHIELFAANDMPYSHIGFMSDNLSFLTRGVNCAFFFTYDWEYGLAESKNNFTIMHQETDNMDGLNTLYKDTYVKFMTDVSDIIDHSLKSPGFESAMINSYENKFDYKIFLNKAFVIGIAAAIFLAVCILAYLSYRKLNKEKALPSVSGTDFIPIEEDTTVFGREFEGKQ